MIPIYYKSSEGVIVDLISPPYMMLTDTDLLNNEWQWETVGTNFPHISALKKQLISPQFSVVVTGSTKDDMMANLEHIEGVFDRDCFLGQMGTLYIGEFSRKCFITSSTKGKVFEKNSTTVQYVATSNNGFWVNEKTVSFSGYGNLVGEMADSVLISANDNNEGIEVTPLSNNKAHIKWNGINYSTNPYWFKLDMGSVMDIDSISGLKLKRTTTAVDVTVQTSDGETVDDARTESVTSAEESTPIFVDDFTQITIDGFGESGWESASLKVIGYFNRERNMFVTYNNVNVGDTIDCADFVYISFTIIYAPSYSTTVEYTVNEEQWTTIDTISVSQGSEEEVSYSNLTCRYFRLKGQFFGTGFDEDLSVISGEEVSARNMVLLGCQTDNVIYTAQDNPVGAIITLVDKTKDGYVYFDDEDVLLKSINVHSITGTGLILQGLNDDTWTDIRSFTTTGQTTYNTTYEKLRLRKPKVTGYNTESISLNLFYINVETDAKIYNDSYAPSNAVIRLSGAWANPYVVINDTAYGANIDLLSGHTLVIDTKNKTVRDYSDTDTYENVYANRIDTSFEAIETGEVNWSGSHKVEITLEQARSTLKWN